MTEDDISPLAPENAAQANEFCALGGESYEQEDMAEARKWFQLAAQLGHPDGQYRLALMDQHGVDGEPNLLSALAWYQRAAVQEHAEAQCQLGTMILTGQGTEPDAEAALQWLQAAAQ